MDAAKKENPALPNPDRVFAAIAAILERRYNIKIDYVIREKEKENAA